jgi:succinate dehydrogenase / fumarate reductase, cytochrome b subunit
MQRWRSLFRSTVGKKLLMALSGAIIFGYAIGHMAGNLQVFLGAEVINAYGRSLREMPLLLWGTRVLLLLAFPVHVVTAAQLVRLRALARPVAYEQRRFTYGSYASRTMRFSGFFLAAFVLFHLAHLTWGWAVTPAPFVEGDIYENLTGSFRVSWVALLYSVAAALVGLHLSHGAWSLFQSLGVDHPRYTPVIKRAGKAISVLVAVGFVAVPLAIFFRLIGGEG